MNAVAKQNTIIDIPIGIPYSPRNDVIFFGIPLVISLRNRPLYPEELSEPQSYSNALRLNLDIELAPLLRVLHAFNLLGGFTE